MQQSGTLILRATIAAAAAALAAIIIMVGEPGRLSWWTGATAFWLWMISPAFAASVIADRNPSSARLLVVGVYLVGFIVSSTVGYGPGLLRPASSTSSLIAVYLPLYQWAALIIVLTAWRGFDLLVRRHPSGE